MSKSKSGKVVDKVQSGKFVDRNLAKVNPLKQQFEPTDKSPVPQHQKMAGAA